MNSQPMRAQGYKYFLSEIMIFQIKWEQWKSFCKISLMQLFNGDRLIVQWVFKDSKVDITAKHPNVYITLTQQNMFPLL